MEILLQNLPGTAQTGTIDSYDIVSVEGPDLRVLHNLLDTVDKTHEWGRLGKILTPEGHYLWLWDKHSEEYRR